MDEFLDMLGQRIDLSEHRGYKGGLDTVHGQTGQHSVYQVQGGYVISRASNEPSQSLKFHNHGGKLLGKLGHYPG